jgi:2-polyprenyl-6-methoxyphenol hydroxylase-like FAD-dependent oxidoreductase
MSDIPKIAIVGAGPAGLTLAAILQKNNVPFTVYDSDASPHERNQGGTLDLHPKGGQAALVEAGLWEQFKKYARPESDVLKVVKNDGEILWDGNTVDKVEIPEEEKFNNRPEIDRSALKHILLGAVKPESVQWGKHLKEAVAGENGTYDLHFTDSTVQTNFDLVVGADGAWSKIRKLVSDTVPEYSGISSVECWSYDVDKKNPWMSEYVGAGSCFSFGEGRAIQMQRLGDGSIRTYAGLRKPESFLKDCGIDWTSPGAIEQFVKEYFDDCGAELKRMILESNDMLVPRILYHLPVGYSWDSRPGVTLVGDAAHLMTPFGGVGVNAAMMDSLSLAQAIIKFVEPGEGKSLSEVIKEYETEMFLRGEAFAKRTMEGLQSHFSAGGSEHLTGRLIAHYRKPVKAS